MVERVGGQGLTGGLRLQDLREWLVTQGFGDGEECHHLQLGEGKLKVANWQGGFAGSGRRIEHMSFQEGIDVDHKLR